MLDKSKREFITSWLKGEKQLEFDPRKHSFIKPSIKDVLEVLRSDGSLIDRIIKKNINPSELHDVIYLEKVADGFDLNIADRGTKKIIRHFEDMFEALNEYLKYSGLK